MYPSLSTAYLPLPVVPSSEDVGSQLSDELPKKLYNLVTRYQIAILILATTLLKTSTPLLSP